jgi:type II secretory pathway pseudopilin PulG
VKGSEAGFSLVAAAASITIMLVLMGMAMPSWKYVMQNAREEELIFRGGQIADAIERYQKKHGNALPV